MILAIAMRISITTAMFIVVPSLAFVLPGGPVAAGRVVGQSDSQNSTN